MIKMKFLKSVHKQNYIIEAFQGMYEEKNDLLTVFDKTDDREIRITSFRRNSQGHLIYDLLHPIIIRGIEASTLNRIWYNITERNYSFEELADIFGITDL